MPSVLKLQGRTANNLCELEIVSEEITSNSHGELTRVIVCLMYIFELKTNNPSFETTFSCTLLVM